jgi:hypothetical protein
MQSEVRKRKAVEKSNKRLSSVGLLLTCARPRGKGDKEWKKGGNACVCAVQHDNEKKRRESSGPSKGDKGDKKNIT